MRSRDVLVVAGIVALFIVLGVAADRSMASLFYCENPTTGCDQTPCAAPYVGNACPPGSPNPGVQPDASLLSPLTYTPCNSGPGPRCRPGSMYPTCVESCYRKSQTVLCKTWLCDIIWQDSGCP